MFFIGLFTSHLTYLFLVLIYISGYGSMIFNSQEADSFSVIENKNISIAAAETTILEDCFYFHQEVPSNATIEEKNTHLYPPHKKPIHCILGLTYKDRLEKNRVTTRPPPAFV